MARRSPTCQTPSSGCSGISSNIPAATEKWWRSWLWFSSTTSKPFYAVELALSDGAPTKTHVLNVLHRLIDGKSSAPPTVDTPQALNVASEPRADVERYDALRGDADGQEARHAS